MGPVFGQVGQASRPAIRQPQFRAEARTHFAAKRPKDREKKCMFTLCRDYDAVDKENDRPTEGRENRPCLAMWAALHLKKTIPAFWIFLLISTG